MFESSNHSIKRKLLSSIFDKKLEFNGQEYRTPKYKKRVEYIYLKINELEKEINKGLVENEISSHLVPLTIPFSNSFYKNLTDIYSLKELLYNEGIADYKGLPLIKPDNSNTLLLPNGY